MTRERLGASGLAVPVLLCLAAVSVALSLVEAAWAPGLEMLPWLVVGAVAFGWLAVRTVLPSWVLHLVSLALGFLVAVFLAGRYDMSALAPGEAAQWVVYRLGRWAYLARSGLPSEDALPFTLLLGLSLWMAFYFSTWLVYRSAKVWWAVAGPAAALLVNTYYSSGAGAAYLFIYAFCSLLLIVRVSLQTLTDDWRAAQIPHDQTIGDDFLFDAVHLVAAVLLLAWLVPPMSLEQRAADLWVRLERPWRSVQQRWEGLFPSVGSGTTGRSTLYGDSLALGGRVQLEDTPLYVVKMREGVRLQSAVYDLYDGRQWWSSASTIALLEPGEYPSIEAFSAREYVEQGVTVLQQTRTLLAASSPRWYGLPVKSEHVPFSVGSGAQALDIYASTARQTLLAGETYRALSAVSRATDDDLRSAGGNQAEWLPSVYYSLPSSVPERLHELAREVTDGAATPYDQALALEEYLRQLEYTTEIEAPPAGRDAVDYFLFDSRQGYCNYFASAMAVMARSLGIPARIAAGYVAGEYDRGAGGYVILGSNGHAWPQLYFPGYGWIDFEPTPSQEVIARSGESDEDTGDEDRDDRGLRGGQGLDELRDPYLEIYGDGTTARPAADDRLGTAVSAGLALAAVVVLLSTVLVCWELPRRRWTKAERVYGDLAVVAWLLGVRRRRPETAAEYGARLAAILPDVSEDVASIVAAFCRARYGGATDAPEDTERLASAWARVARATRQALPRRFGLSRAGR